MEIDYNINKEPYGCIADWDLAVQSGDTKEQVENYLYDLHKKVWSSSEIIPERLKIYEEAVESYKNLGFDIGEHKYYVLLYNYILRRRMLNGSSE